MICIIDAATVTGALSKIKFYTGFCINFFTIDSLNKELKNKVSGFTKKTV